MVLDEDTAAGFLLMLVVLRSTALYLPGQTDVSPAPSEYSFEGAGQ